MKIEQNKSNEKEKKSPVFNAAKLKDLRLQSKLSVYKLCEISGVNESKIHKIEKGVIKEPTFATVAAIARALGVSNDVFVNELCL